MTIDQAMAATGKSESAMRRAAQEGDFTFKSKHADLDRDMKLIKRLTALRDAGISRFSGCKQVEISDTLLRQLELQYDFTVKESVKRIARPSNANARTAGQRNRRGRPWL